MARDVMFICQECGAQQPRWFGKCPECEQWNTCQEEFVIQRPGNKSLPRKGPAPVAVPLSEVIEDSNERWLTGFKEIDRVLGGGVVAGSVVLIGGAPGIGKSTIMLQILASLGKTVPSQQTVLYCSGEESIRQTKLRADRLGLQHARIQIAAETNITQIERLVSELHPKILVVDSIQSVYLQDLPSAPGTVAQVRESAARLMRLAKNDNFPVFLVGHVTKEGTLAGPRVLEHMVDAVLYFEGDQHHAYRLLRAVKNRFGSTNEIGLFEMRAQGLQEVLNPSQVLLSQRVPDAPGSAVGVTLEGSRPLLVEIQALCAPSSGYSMPRRTTSGVDPNRLAMLLAVLEKRCGLPMASQDVFLNVAGGLTLDEPATDLPACLAMISSLRNQPLPTDQVAFGEIGLGGEIRSVSGAERRVREALQLGFSSVLLPTGNQQELTEAFPKNQGLVFASNLKEVLNFFAPPLAE